MGTRRDHGDGPFAAGKVATATPLGKELVEARPDVIGKLYPRWFQPYGTHAYRDPTMKALYGGVEYNGCRQTSGYGEALRGITPAQASPRPVRTGGT